MSLIKKDNLSLLVNKHIYVYLKIAQNLTGWLLILIVYSLIFGKMLLG